MLVDLIPSLISVGPGSHFGLHGTRNANVWMCFSTFVSRPHPESHHVQSSRNRIRRCRPTIFGALKVFAGREIADSGAQDGCVGFLSFLDWCVKLAGIGLQPKFLTIDGHPKTCGGVGEGSHSSACSLLSCRLAQLVIAESLVGS